MFMTSTESVFLLLVHQIFFNLVLRMEKLKLKVKLKLTEDTIQPKIILHGFMTISTKAARY